MIPSQKSVERNISHIRHLVAKKNFEKAIKFYRVLEQEFKNLDQESKKLFSRSVDLVSKELELYLRINEAYFFAEGKDLERLKEESEKIKSLAFELSSRRESADVDTLLSYTDRHYKFFLDVYNYRIAIKDFNKMFLGTKKAFEEKDFDVGLKSYAELLIAYNALVEVVDSEQRSQLYKKVKSLFDDVSMQRLIHFATEKPQKIHLEVSFPKLQPVVRELKLARSLHFDPRFEKMHEFLDEERLSDAIDVYEELTKEKKEVNEDFKVSKFRKVKVQPIFRNIEVPEYGVLEGDFRQLRKLIKEEKVSQAKKAYHHVFKERLK